MAKKEGIGSEIKSIIKDAISTNLISHAKTYMKDFAHKAQEVAYQTEKKIVENLFAGAVMMMGFALIVIAVVYFVNDFFDLDRYWGFLIIGLILIVFSFIYKRSIEKRKYYKFER